MDADEDSKGDFLEQFMFMNSIPSYMYHENALANLLIYIFSPEDFSWYCLGIYPPIF